jgi:sugar/nucleoside kinase (ribokinase family)
MGELLVEIMRPRVGIPFYEQGEFLGPFPSGAPAIFIDTVARLGHPAGMIGGVAEDDFGKCLLDRLKADGVDVRYVERVPGAATAVAFVTYFQDGSRKYIFHIDNTPAVEATFASRMQIAPPAFFHVMGCSLMANVRFREEIVKAVERFYEMGTRVSFDPNIRVELLGDESLMDVIGPVLAKTAVLMPGVSELRLVSGQEEIGKAVDHLFGNPELEIIVLKQGKSGATVFTRETHIEIPSYAVEEVDPTGAGDCFDAGFLCGLLEEKPLEECGKIAAAAGALNAAAFGPMEGRINPQTIQELIKAD